MTKLKKIEAKLTEQPYVPSSDDATVELRRLVREHAALTRRAVAIENMVSPRTARQDIPARGLEKGDEIPCDVPEDARVDAMLLAEGFRKRAEKLESRMLKQLKQIPIYRLFLANVWGVGPIVAAYLVAEIDITKALKPSSLRMFCGLAVVDGALVRRTKGIKLPYNGELRTRLFQLFAAMWRNAGGEEVRVDAKYIRIWRDYKNRMANSPRVEGGKIAKVGGKTPQVVSAKGFVHSTGWHKAADVFITDLYMVWRAIEGLPVWCPYVAAKLTGYWHASAIEAWQGGRILSVDEALELVGHVGKAEIAVAAE